MSEQIKKQKGHFRRNWSFYLLLILFLGFNGYQFIANKFTIKKQTNNSIIEKEMLLEQVQEVFNLNTEQQLELMMRTFVWAVRGELTRDNKEQVDQYFKQLVKAEKIEEITLIDKSGSILISTNKKNEGSQLNKNYNQQVINIDEMALFDNDNNKVVAAPIMSLDSKIGTLIIIYKADSFKFKT